jgi:hypothetical protein
MRSPIPSGSEIGDSLYSTYPVSAATAVVSWARSGDAATARIGNSANSERSLMLSTGKSDDAGEASF